MPDKNLAPNQSEAINERAMTLSSSSTTPTSATNATTDKGFHGDTSAMVMVGDVSDEARALCQVTKSCLLRGSEQIRCGTRLGDLGYAVEEQAHTLGFSVVAEYGGHGIGRRMH